MHNSALYLILLTALFITPSMAYAQNITKEVPIQPVEKAPASGSPTFFGADAIMEAEARGLIRKADQKDIEQYRFAQAKAQGLPDHIIEYYLQTSHAPLEQTYVVLSPDFVIPYGLADLNNAGMKLIVPAGLPEPQGPRGFCRVISYDQIEASVAERIPESCKFAKLTENPPPEAKVYALGVDGYDRSPKLEVQIDAKKTTSILKKIIVNSPAEPVILLLQVDHPHIWHFSWTQGTKILAVYISGGYTQAVSGLPEDVPVFINDLENGARPCPTIFFSKNLESLRRLNNLSNHLFNHDIDRVQDIESRAWSQMSPRAVLSDSGNLGKAGGGHPPAKEIVVGEPLAENSRLESAEELDVEKYRISSPIDPSAAPSALRAALLRQAIAKRLIRTATEEDRRQYLVARARAEGLSDETVKNFIEKDMDRNNRLFYAPYTVLSSAFFSSDGLYNERMTGSFFVLEGLTVPEKERQNITIYSYDELKELDQKPLDKTCQFPKLTPDLVPSGKVYAVSDRLGKELGFQIEGSSKPAKLMELQINSPDEPVFLLLSSYDPTIWRFSWTRGTKIAAVYISSRYKQIIAGLADDVPLYINNQEEQLSACPPLKMVIGYEQLVADNDLARHLFHQSIDKVYLSSKQSRAGRVVIGRPLDDGSRLESADEWAGPEKFAHHKTRSRPRLFKGQAGLREAQAEGLIRAATPEEIISHIIAAAKDNGLPDHLIKSDLDIKDSSSREYFMLLSPNFLDHFDSSTIITNPVFISPQDLLRPNVKPLNPANNKFTRYGDGELEPKKQVINESFKFTNLPAAGQVYAMDRDSHWYLGKALDFHLDDSSSQARLIKVTVNSPDEPVFLMLRNGGATVWHFNWTKGTKIAAVYIEGYARQAVSGLPPDVPVLTCVNSGSTADPSQCPGIQIPQNDLSRHLFNKDIYKLQMVRNVYKDLIIGRPPEKNSPLESAEELQPEKFRDFSRPRLGMAGIEESEAKGLIRKATQADIKEYLEARAKAEGLPDHIIKNGFQTDGYIITKNPYVVLSPDFIMPDQMGWERISLIVPPGLPAPASRPWIGRGAPLLIYPRQKSPWTNYSFVYSYDDLAQDFSRKITPPIACVFKYSADGFPDKAKVYALGADSGAELDFSIEGSLKPARLMKVTVNSPEAPALLILKANDPTIWHFNWTRGTQIAGVYLSGEWPQLVSGLPEGVPLLKSDQDMASQCPKFNISSSLVDLVAVNNLSQVIFNRDLEEALATDDSEKVIGQPLSKKSWLAGAAEFDPNQFRAPSTPTAGPEGLNEAMAKGLIRKAGPEDIEQYQAAKREAEIRVRTELEELPRNIIEKMGYGRRQDVAMPNPYVVMSPDFVIPARLTGDEAASFIVPEGLPVPEGPLGDCLVFRYEGMVEERKKELESRTGQMGVIRTHSYPVSRPKFSSNCVLPKPVTPDKVYAIGDSPGRRLDFQIDDSGAPAHLMRLTVNAPQESVALFLTTNRPMIWRLEWTRGTKISAVIISGGQYKQIVSGLPEDVPVLLSPGAGYDPSFCPPNFEIALGRPHTVQNINGLSHHLFNKGLADIENLKYGPYEYVVGKPLTEDSRVESAERLDLSKFNAPDKPLAGEAGLKEAVARGLIRRATRADVEKYLTARNEAGGLTEEAVFKMRQRDLVAAGGKLGCGRTFSYGGGKITDADRMYADAYVVLSPDFVIPPGLSFPNFYVPKDMPAPKGSAGCGEIFSYDDLLPTLQK